MVDDGIAKVYPVQVPASNAGKNYSCVAKIYIAKVGVSLSVSLRFAWLRSAYWRSTL